MSNKVPNMTTDNEAEAFLEQDLTDYLDLKNWQKVSIEMNTSPETKHLKPGT